MDALVTVISLGTRTELWLDSRRGPFALKHKRKNGSGMRHNRMLETLVWAWMRLPYALKGLLSGLSDAPAKSLSSHEGKMQRVSRPCLVSL